MQIVHWQQLLISFNLRLDEPTQRISIWLVFFLLNLSNISCKHMLSSYKNEVWGIYHFFSRS